MIKKIKNNFLGIITTILIILLFLMSPRFKLTKYEPTPEDDPYWSELVSNLELIDYKVLNSGFVEEYYQIPRLVFNAYPEKISLKDNLFCQVYELEIKNNQINNIKEKINRIKDEQKNEYETHMTYLKNRTPFSPSTPNDDRDHLYLYQVPKLENGKINLDIANKYIDLCASENSLAKIKEQDTEVLGDLDFFKYVGDGRSSRYRAYPVLVQKGKEVSTVKIIVFGGLNWWHFKRFSR
jgi:hypothetical protein